MSGESMTPAEIAADRSVSRRPGPSSGSWADRLTDAIADLPVPEPVLYLGAGALLALILVAAEWASGGVAVGTVPGAYIVLVGSIVISLWFVGAMNRAARSAMRGATPLVVGGLDRATELEARLVRSPAGLTFALGVAFVAVTFARFLVEPGLLASLGFSGRAPALWVGALCIVLGSFAAAAAGLKMALVAWQVHRITTRELVVDIWNLGPLLAFANLTALLAAVAIAGIIGSYLTGQANYADALGLSIAIGGIAAASVVFVLPLVGVHGRMAAAKRAAQDDLARQLEAAMVELKASLAARSFESMDGLNKALGGIEIARRAVDRVPTWPWEPETFRWVVGALMFPILVLVLQFLVSRA